MDIGPDSVGNCDVVTELWAVQHPILVGLVVTGPHNVPAPSVRIVTALDDRIVLHAIALCIHRNTTIVQGQIDIVGVGCSRDHRLERRGHTRSQGCLLGHLWRCVLTRHRLARIHHITRSPRDIQRSLDNTLPQGRVKALAILELDQEVNAVVRGRLPLVHHKPGATLRLISRRHRSRARSKDQTVDRVVKGRIQDLADCLLHRISITRQEHLRHDAKGLAARQRREIPRDVGHKGPRTPQTRLAHILLADEQGQAPHVTSLVPVDVEDVELIAIAQVFAIDNAADMNVLRCRQTRPGHH